MKRLAVQIHVGVFIVCLAFCLTLYSDDISERAKGEASVPKGKESMLLDFGKGEVSELFNEPKGGLICSIGNIPEASGGNAEGGPSGRVLRIKSPAKGFIYTKNDFLPDYLPECESLSMWVYRASEGATIVFEIQLLEDEGRSKFWRKVEIVRSGWTKIVVPLRFMRKSEEKSPCWKKIRHLGFFFREDTDICIDNLSLISGTGKTAVLAPEELSEMAFPNSSRQQIKILKNPDFVIVSNCNELEMEKLEKRMSELFGMVKKDLSGLKEYSPDSPPLLAIFATKEEYSEFTPRLAGILLGKAPPPSSGGYTIHSIATSYWDPGKKTLRPVYFHEMMHSWLDRMYGFPCGNGDWLQEGIASYYQFILFPQDNLWKIIEDGVSDQAKHTPLDQLCNGRRISIDRYWQAMSIIAMLQMKEVYRGNFTKLLNVLIERGSTNLNPVINDILGVDMEKFSSDWKEFCREYAKQLKQ